MRITHLISNLSLGGAEGALALLIEASSGSGLKHSVISLLPGGENRDRIKKAGGDVIELNGRRGIAAAAIIGEVHRQVRNSRPDVVQGWMYHANAAATLAKLMGGTRYPIVWGVRQGAEQIALDRLLTRAVIRFGALMSNSPEAIVYNSETAARGHEQIGYARAKTVIIENGVDCRRFQPDAAARSRLLAELGLPENVLLIGRVARYAKMKDFPTLIHAFRLALERLPNAHLVMVGNGIETQNAELIALCKSAGCLDHMHLLGPRSDVAALYPAFDILASSSKANEGFPNTIAEALACGTLVATTSVGEVKLIRDGCHLVVEPSDHRQLALGLISLLGLPVETRRALGARGRTFIEDNFSSTRFADKFVALYRKLGVTDPVS